MTPAELEEQIPWEAEHHIPFSKDDVEIDHQLITGEAAGDGQMELLLVAAKKEVVADYSMVIREAKLVPTVMDVAAFTIQNAFEANYPVVPEEAIAVINVGATLSNINIIAGGTSAFTRDVTVGGNAFTEEIQKRLNVSQEEAEAWKIGSAGEGANEVVPQEVEAVIASVADGVAGKFQRSLDFYLASSTDATISKIYLCGGSAKVPALQRALESKARTAVEVMDPFRKVAVDARRFDVAFVQQHSAEAAVAVGLSLRRLGDKQ
jgi:type IV pilus assembly protein PilM